MSKEQKQALDELKAALGEVPEKLRGDVTKAVTHDISVMARALGIAAKKDKKRGGCDEA